MIGRKKTYSSDGDKLPHQSTSSSPIEQQPSSLIMTRLLTLQPTSGEKRNGEEGVDYFHLLLLQEAPIPPDTTTATSLVNVGDGVELVGSVDPANGGVVHGWVSPGAPRPHQGQARLVLAHLTWAFAAKSCP